MRDQLTALAQQMLDKGIRLEEAHREFERIFIQRALAKCDFNQRCGIDIDMQQVGDDAADLTKRAIRGFARDLQDILYTGVEPLEALFQFSQHGDSLTRAS